MEERAYHQMFEIEETHWWYCGRRLILRQVLDQLFRTGMPNGPLYDLGCGVGSNLSVLERHGPSIGFDGSKTAVNYAHSRGRMEVQLADLTQGWNALAKLNPAPGSVVLLADVIEHLDDDQSALTLAHRILAPGGALIVTVPALPSLWGPADEFNHHRRRYTRESLSQSISACFEVERITFFNSVLFPPIAVARKILNLLHFSGEVEGKVPSAWVNRVLKWLFCSETYFLPHMDFPIGVSLLCVARKGRGPTR